MSYMALVLQLARGGRHRAAASVRLAGLGRRTAGVLETGAACTIGSLLQAAGGSIFSPPAPVGWAGEGGG